MNSIITIDKVTHPIAYCTRNMHFINLVASHTIASEIKMRRRLLDNLVDLENDKFSIGTLSSLALLCIS